MPLPNYEYSTGFDITRTLISSFSQIPIALQEALSSTRQCQYIKSLRDFAEYTGQPMETPVREERLWWRMTLKR
jgi:hypothetical protein